MAGTFRRQVPVRSPLTIGAIAGASMHALSARDPHSALEILLRAEFNARTISLLGSGTQALAAAIRIGISREPGPVALPAFGCYDLASAAIGAGADVVLYDIEPDSLAPSWTSVEAALRKGARTIVIAYLYGYPVDWDAAADLAHRYGAFLIEDAAQGAGGSWQGAPLGSLGDASVLSFGRGKGWTGSRGGAMLLRDQGRNGDSLPGAGALEETVDMAKSLAQWALARPSIYRVPASLPFLGLGETHYRMPQPARTMGRAAAALALRTWPLTVAENARRHANALLLDRTFAELPCTRRILPSGGEPGFLRYPVLMKHGSATLLRAPAATRLGVAASYPAPLSKLPELSAHLVVCHTAPRISLAGAEYLSTHLVTIPVHSAVTPAEAALTIDLIQTVCNDSAP